MEALGNRRHDGTVMQLAARVIDRQLNTIAVRVYDHGGGTLGEGVLGIKLRAVSISWLTG